MGLKRNFCVLIFAIVYFSSLSSIAVNGDRSGKTVDTSDVIKKLRNKIQRKVNPASPIYKYLDDDVYILQWLKANAFSVKYAEAHFLEHLAWRRKFKIDMILKEDWISTGVSSEYPIFTDTIDKYGRPCAEVWLSDWNIRRAIMSGRGKQLIRWQIYRLEKQQKRLFDIRRAGGTNVTGALEIHDFQDFNAWTQGCAPCMPVMMQMFLVWEKHYGGITESVYMVNMRPSVYNFFKLIGRQISSAAAPGAFKPYQSKRDWLPVLDSVIERDQRSVRFGGSLDRKIVPLVADQGTFTYYF